MTSSEKLEEDQCTWELVHLGVSHVHWFVCMTVGPIV